MSNQHITRQDGDHVSINDQRMEGGKAQGGGAALMYAVTKANVTIRIPHASKERHKCIADLATSRDRH